MSNLLLTDTIGPIIYDRTKSYFKDRITVYNSLTDIPLHKIWIHIDRCKITDINNMEISIALSIKNQKLISLIRNLEDEILKKLRSDIAQRLCIESKLYETDSFAPILLITYDNDTTFFQHDGEQTTFNIKKNLDITTIIELNYFQLDNNILRPHWKALQIKQHELINLNKFITCSGPCHIPSAPPPTYSYNQETMTIPVPPPAPVRSPPIFPPHTTTVTTTTTTKSPSETQVRFVINENELKNILTNLKKKKTASSSSPLLPPQISQASPILLNKVTTKEPLSVKQSYENNKLTNLMLNDSDITESMETLTSINTKLKFCQHARKQLYKNIKKIYDEINEP